MSEPFVYTVTASLPDEATAADYLDWLQAGHVEEVVRAGALRGEIVRLDGPNGEIRISSRYIFPDRAAFERYEAGPAAALRADGARRFGPDSGRAVGFARETGSILRSYPA